LNGMADSVSLLPGGSAPAGASSNAEPLTLGVMGGGQLGRMFVHAAQTMGYFTAVLDPDANSPGNDGHQATRPCCFGISEHFIGHSVR